MKRRKLLPLVVLGLASVGCQATRAGYETAPYRVLQAKGDFEVRDYPVLTIVETQMSQGGSGSSDSFQSLFRFITGANDAKQEIPMTTPVFMLSANSDATMAFVMPAKMKAREVPRPSDSLLTVRELPAGRFAVLRFSGGRDGKKEETCAKRLREWLASEGLKELSPPIYGYFDPPWIPAFLRRNEVMIRIEVAEQN